MKLLLCKSIEHLGIVGDVVDVSTGYARNYLLPHRLATQPTSANMRALTEARRQAELEQSRVRATLEALCRRLEGAEVTIRAKANEQGHLYGSVGAKEISQALQAEGFGVNPTQVDLAHPIRQLDSTEVSIKLAGDLVSPIKVWVVRENIAGEGEGEASGEEPAEERAKAGMEAGSHGNDSES